MPFNNHQQTLASYQVLFKGEALVVNLVYQNTAVPELLYYIYKANNLWVLLSPYTSDGNTWVAKGLSFIEAQELHGTIQNETGYILPSPAKENPFTKKNASNSDIQNLLIGELKIEKAKSPYLNDLYYRFHFPGRTLTLLKWSYGQDTLLWLPVEPVSPELTEFRKLTRLVDNYEALNRVY